MKKLLISFMMLLLPMIAVAEGVEIDGIYYNLVSKANIAEVTSNPNKYSGDVVIPETVEYGGSIYDVTSIGDNAFNSCSNLISITIPNSVTNIGNWAFQNCTALTSIIILNSVTDIGIRAFDSCTSLTSVKIPSSVTTIGAAAFSGCSSLSSINVDQGNIYYDSRNNCNAIINTTNNNLISGCKNTIIPNDVISIEISAFAGCTGLNSITIPNSVTNIGDWAFSCCTGLTSIKIPNNVTNLGISAFADCTSLITIIIGSGIKTIYSYAFARCPRLKDVYCYADNVPSKIDYLFYGNNIFTDSNISAATLYVPTASIESYKSTEPWRDFMTIMGIEGIIPQEPETQKCATPVIIYENGKLMFACATEGVEYVTNITCADIKKHYSSAIDLTGTYTVSVYATKSGYDNSDVATKEIQITGSSEGSGKRGDLNNDGEVNASDAVTLVNIIMNNQ